MAKSNDLLALANAGLRGDKALVVKICKSIISNESCANTLKVSLSRQLEQMTKNPHTKYLLSEQLVPNQLKGLVVQCEPEKALQDLVLPLDVKPELDAFLEEQINNDVLQSFNLVASNRVLLSGPPGNGKTSLAEALANELKLPFLTVDFSKVISSHLGSTGENIAKVFRNASGSPCVLFIDEMETLLSERAGVGGRQDVGEAARIVSTLLLEIDRMSDQVVLVGATNHIEMLDRAVVRRFDYHWELGMPSEEQKSELLLKLATQIPRIPIDNFNLDTSNMSMSDLEKKVMKRCKEWALQSTKVTKGCCQI
ncbi:ATP-binding protein [Vibrio tubiashii]|uniref:AAA family ATPase n=1 Tax=Vibrio tubiashii TaxID=29498 RepID=UPI001EFE48C3|nr:ATP-binding protein [Vibrio tubiashii]MCG9576082.1 ATP-binding protein [Vibrio tubiashii]